MREKWYKNGKYSDMDQSLTTISFHDKMITLIIALNKYVRQIKSLRHKCVFVAN